MARGKKSKNEGSDLPISDYRYDTTRKNNLPAKIAAEGHQPAINLVRHLVVTGKAVVLGFFYSGQSQDKQGGDHGNLHTGTCGKDATRYRSNRSKTTQ
ncbi:MAG: hypothetical protein QG599_2021 [Pseudomonadota bacterium]|nr:hypothetical protein [Pseudomonadota bacterium]